jgi:hypothetical protein
MSSAFDINLAMLLRFPNRGRSNYLNTCSEGNFGAVHVIRHARGAPSFEPESANLHVQRLRKVKAGVADRATEAQKLKKIWLFLSLGFNRRACSDPICGN